MKKAETRVRMSSTCAVPHLLPYPFFRKSFVFPAHHALTVLGLDVMCTYWGSVIVEWISGSEPGSHSRGARADPDAAGATLPLLAGRAPMRPEDDRGLEGSRSCKQSILHTYMDQKLRGTAHASNRA